jgi:kynurenine formamidase
VIVRIDTPIGPLSFDGAAPISIGTPLGDPDHSPRAFGLPPTTVRPFTAGSFVARLAAGAPINCDILEIAPHGAGTHTETARHASDAGPSLAALGPRPLRLALLVTVAPDAGPVDHIVRAYAVEAAAAPFAAAAPSALIVRVLRDGLDHVDFSGQNPPFFDPRIVAFLDELGVVDLLTDLPSVDREEDGGALAFHRAFWGISDAGVARPDRTITEMAALPPTLADGLYLLAQAPLALVNDASPTAPALFPRSR